MKIMKKMVTRVMLSSSALVLAVLLLPAFLITDQIDGFQQLVDMIFKDDETPS
ncbi:MULTISPECIES: hypothetical protein [Geomicrobium]|uniref:Cyclic lactone autoinducer peptide n=1 Tax=Geomicrobium sediminis TaxID=1347788 RepID=A0ABS2PGV7_9BACL|nr:MULTISPECIES: hypothetical protein [Geomicrobium]MBM7634670.1 hypothetical protein [Geomicrobium sediminis]GAK09551.1 hypothetical protein JCM19038_3392 [Geomicrobium sp. JCM 19038]